MTTSPTSRLVCWFSCGATSAVATRIALVENTRREGGPLEPHVVYIDTGSEHPDNRRFLRDVEAWIEHPVEIIRSSEYGDTWDVWIRTRWLNGPQGARCTTELKKLPRRAYSRPDDVQVFGYDAMEEHRVARFRKENPEVNLSVPLIGRCLSKPDCLALLERAGIALPAMYRLGFTNANCIGCVKGKMGYWNKIRREFPETFARMARLEREIGHALCKREDGPDRRASPVFLDELDPAAGRDDEVLGECSLLCAAAEEELREKESP